MRIKPLAIAMLAIAPASVLAQSGVTMYGIADAGLAYVKPDSSLPNGSRSNRKIKVDSGIQSTSRWGVRGIEDLGGGMAAIFNAEVAWNVDDGTGNSSNALNFDRRSIVGLQGGFGQVYFGREYTPAFYAGGANDINGYQFFGTSLGYYGNGFGPVRYSNGVFYNTPTWSGLQIRTAFGNGAGTGTEYDTAPKGRDRNIDVAALYAYGPWKANAYYRFGNQDAATVAAPAAQPALRKIRQYGVGGGYDFGPARVTAQYAGSNPDHAANAPGTIPGALNGKVNMFGLGVAVRAGAGEVLLQGWQVKFADDYGNGKPKATFASLAYTYPLSKRTNLYASYGRGRNQNGASVTLFSGSAPVTSDAAGSTAMNSAPQALGLGIRHQF